MTAKAHITFQKPDSKSYTLASKNRGTTRFESSFNTPYDRIMHLQRNIGNQAVNRILKSDFLEAKLQVGEPNEKYEQEADRVADQVMNKPKSQIKRQIEKRNKFQSLVQYVIQSMQRGEEFKELDSPNQKGEDEIDNIKSILVQNVGEIENKQKKGNTVQARQTRNTGSELPIKKADLPHSINRSLYSLSRRRSLSKKSFFDGRFRALSLSYPVLNIQRQVDKRDYSEDCSRYIGSGVSSSEFYSCREANNANRCGQSGYYLGYGLKYCKRFNLETKKKLSPAGKKWVDKTTKCLQEYLQNNIAWDAPCKEVKKKAFDSHPSCYLKSGLCSLPASDLWHIILTIDSSDYELKQTILTGIGCLIRWSSILMKGFGLSEED